MGKITIHLLYEWSQDDEPFWELIAAFITKEAAKEFAKNRHTDTYYKIDETTLHSKYPNVIVTETV